MAGVVTRENAITPEDRAPMRRRMRRPLRLLTPAIRRAGRAARAAAESPRETGTEPIAGDRRVGKRTKLLGVVKHTAGHQIEVDAGKKVGDADAGRDAVLAGNRRQALRVTHGSEIAESDAAGSACETIHRLESGSAALRDET